MPRSAKILVVDDEPVIRELVREILAIGGNEVVDTPSTNEALDAADRLGPFDVALIDKNLPDGSGIEVARRLRNMSPNTELILMTAYPSLDSAIEVLRLGAFDYIIKPFEDVNELRLKVQNAAERSWLRRSHKELAQQLGESENRYRDLVEASPDAIVVYDPAGAIVQVNNAAIKLYGHSEQQLVGKKTSELFGPDRQDRRHSQMATGIVRRIDRHADGGDLPVEVRSATATLHGEEVVVEIVRDIRARLGWEDEKSELEDRLRGVQKLESLGRLAGGVAHDFNNLLVVILNYVDFIGVTVDDMEPLIESDELRKMTKQLRSLARDIGEAGDSAATLTRQLLAFSRDQVIAPEPLSINSVIEMVVRLLKRTMREDVELSCELEQNLGVVKMDRGQLQQLLMNLAVNARDAMPEGGSMVIRTANVELADQQARKLRLPAGNYAHISISDTGVGIPDDILQHIYEPFFTTKGAEHGTGLGLATAYQIAEQADGVLQVSTELHEGTTFDVYLPHTDEQSPSRAESQTPVDQRGKGETILVVEDEAGVRKLVRRLLTGAGYQVLEAKQGAEGLAAFRQRQAQIDLVLTDVMMPRLKGSDLASKLRALKEDVKLVYMSGYAAGNVVRDSVHEGRATFLAKPFSKKQLLSTVREALDS